MILGRGLDVNHEVPSETFKASAKNNFLSSAFV